MKTAKKIGISGMMLSSVKEAEASLARQESQDLEKGIPDGHPLRDEVEKQKALLGDLSGLPPGHPLLRAMQLAKESYEKIQEQKQSEQDKVSKVKKAKKVDADKAARNARRIEEENAEKRASAAKMVNTGIDGSLVSIRGLYRVIGECEEILNNDPMGRARVSRLKRLLYATERGLSDCRIVRS